MIKKKGGRNFGSSSHPSADAGNQKQLGQLGVSTIKASVLSNHPTGEQPAALPGQFDLASPHVYVITTV